MSADVQRWEPRVADVLRRHGLPLGAPCVAGASSTHPTFVVGDVVVKLFGGSSRWRASHAHEHAALQRLARAPAIAAPRLLAAGELAAGSAESSPYLVTSRMPGVAWCDADLSPAQRLAIAADLGQLIGELHGLDAPELVPPARWRGLDVAAAAGRSSLPDHLVAQVDGYLARLGEDDATLVHGDLCSTHVFVDGGRLRGVIDWGDAMVTDRHYELIQLQRDLFDGDAELLRVLLDASGWPVGDDFASRALGHALRRQAVGLAQHRTMDVFEPVAARWPLDEVATLDELARLLFDG